MKKMLLLLVVLFSTFSFAQNKPNILISRKYEFQKADNSYNLNNMFKGILSSSFNVYFENDELPRDIAENKCNALSGFLVENSGMFNTKMKFIIKDCQNKVVYESAEVKSKEKDYQVAYNEVMRLLAPEVRKFALTRPLVKKESPVIVETKSSIEKEKVVESPKVSEFKTFLNCKLEEVFNGFHVIEVRDGSGSVLLSMQKTKNPNVFIAHKDATIGIFTKIENKGVFEYYIDNKYIVEEYQF